MKLGRNRLLISAVLLIVVVAAVVAYLLTQTGSPAAAEAITPQEYQARFADADHLLIDVRTPEEYADGHIAGAVNIPLQEIETRLAEIPTDRDVVVYCHSGNRSGQAARILTEHNYIRIYDLGGLIAWQAAGYSVE